MEVLFFNRPNTSIILDIEVIYFYNLYLLAEVTEYHSSISYNMSVWKSRNNWPLDFTIDLYYRLSPPEFYPMEKDEMMRIYKLTNKIKAVKYKSKNDIVQLQSFLHMFELLKNKVLNYFRSLLETTNLMEWEALFDNEIAVAAGFSTYGMKEKGEDDFIALLSDTFITRQKLLIFGGVVSRFLNELNLTGDKSMQEGTPGFCSIPLLTIPFCKKMPNESMKILRSYLQGKFGDVSNEIEKFRSSIVNESFDSGIIEKIFAFSQNINPFAESFQAQIDSQIYFQQMMNASDDWYNVELRMGVCSFSTMSDYYEKSEILLPFVAEALKRKLSLKLDIQKCDAFLYFVLPDTEQNGLDDIQKAMSEELKKLEGGFEPMLR